MENMRHIVHAGRLAVAFLFIESAWREYSDEGTWRVFRLDGEVAAGEYILGGGIVVKGNHIISFGIQVKLFGGILLILNTYLGALLLIIYQAILIPILEDFYNRDFVRFQKSFQHFLHIGKSFCVESQETTLTKLCDQDDGLAMSCYNSIVEHKKLRGKACNQINEIEREAMCNPLFIQRQISTFDMPFIKGVGIVAVLVFFVAMEHKIRIRKAN